MTERAGRGVFYEGAGKFSLGDSPAVSPGPGEVRLQVAYCGVCGTDLHIAHGGMDARVPTPMVIGHEMSGTIAELGDGVAGLAVGDAAVVRPLDTRDATPADKGWSHIGRNLRFIGIDSPGAFQTSWTVPAFTVHPLPQGLDLRHAALVEPLAVACHDLRRARLERGELAVVIGGGPIGLMIALTAVAEGARALLSEVDEPRRAFAAGLGLHAIDPTTTNLPKLVAELSDDAGADVVFEVSGSPAGALAMTELAGIRSRVVVVAIYPEPQPVRLFDLFWKELEVLGARVYEPEDYDRAIELLASSDLQVGELISRIEPLTRLPEVLEEMKAHPVGVKTLIDCRA